MHRNAGCIKVSKADNTHTSESHCASKSRHYFFIYCKSILQCQRLFRNRLHSDEKILKIDSKAKILEFKTMMKIMLQFRFPNKGTSNLRTLHEIFLQTKHHWWWKINRVFNGLKITKDFFGSVLFIEVRELAVPFSFDDSIVSLILSRRITTLPLIFFMCLAWWKKKRPS